MDQPAFTHLTTAIARATSRRAALRAIAASLLGVTAGQVAESDASAATSCRRGRQTCQRNAQCCSGSCRTGRDVPLRDRNRCTCEEGLALCGNACVDTDTDVRNCGACGNQCGAGDTCFSGTCVVHQQCYTRDSGLCYMTADGRERRGDGAMLVGFSGAIECVRNSDCANFQPMCDIPAIDCTCVRAIDFGGGYLETYEAGRGACLPMLDNGDNAVMCNATPDVTTCLYSADGQEVSVCVQDASAQGPCDEYGCAGVGMCDNEGATCTCAVAINLATIQGFNLYLDYTLEGPTCVAYHAPVDGACEPPV